MGHQGQELEEIRREEPSLPSHQIQGVAWVEPRPAPIQTYIWNCMLPSPHAYLFNVGQKELLSLLLAFPESLAHSVVQGAHGSLWAAAISRTRALLAQVGSQPAQPNQA